MSTNVPCSYCTLLLLMSLQSRVHTFTLFWLYVWCSQRIRSSSPWDLSDRSISPSECKTSLYCVCRSGWLVCLLCRGHPSALCMLLPSVLSLSYLYTHHASSVYRLYSEISRYIPHPSRKYCMQDSPAPVIPSWVDNFRYTTIRTVPSLLSDFIPKRNF